MSGVGITYLWPDKEFPPFIRLEGKRGDYEVYTLERTCQAEPKGFNIRFYVCSACGHTIDHFDAYCKTCGAKVVDIK